MLLIIRYHILADQLLKRSIIQQNRVLKKRLRILTKIPNTNGLSKKADCNTKITGIGNKIHSVSGLVTTAALKTKATEIENKIFDITNLATKAALNTKSTEVKRKTPNIINLVARGALNTKPQILKTKYLKPHILLLLLSLNDLQKYVLMQY